MTLPHPLIKTYFLRYFLPLALVASALLIISWYSLYQAEKKVFASAEQKSTDAVAVMLTNEVRNVISDLNCLAQSHELQESFSEKPELHLKKLAYDFLTFSIQKRVYDQIRFLDKAGMEVVRVNYNNGKPVIVSQGKLQSKLKRYYFLGAMKLSQQEVFISPLDLNMEHSQIEKPLKPMLRFATPVFDDTGKKRGIVLLNYFGTYLLEKLSFMSRGNSVELMLVNMEGYWLKGVTPEEEWGFMFDDRKDATFSGKYTDAWQQISREDAGQFSTKEGLFTFATIRTLVGGKQSSNRSVLHGKKNGQPDQHAYMWKVVSRVPPKVLSKHPNSMQRYILPPFLAFFIVLAILAFKLNKSQLLRNIAEQKLHEVNKTLEQKVTERTKQLKKVNRELYKEVELYNQSQMDLKVFENRCQNILEAISDGIIGVDQQGIAVFVNNNALEILRYQEDEVLRHDTHSLIHHSTADGQVIPEDDCHVRITIQNGTSFLNRRTTFWKKDDTSFPVEVTCSPVLTNRKIIGAVIVFRDISSRLQEEEKQQELEAQLYHTQKMEAIGTLAGGIAHDFNNILSAILGFTEISLFGIEKESELEADLLQIKKAGLRAKDLVAQILAFSRGGDTNLTQVELTGIIKEVLKLLRSSMPSTIEIRQHFGDTNNCIMADPVQIHQVLMNLGTNAMFAMKVHGGTLTVELSSMQLDEQACRVLPNLQPGLFEQLIIRDTGCGMDADTQDRIFDPFFTTKKEREGTGLGLSTVHGIVKNFGGHIAVASKPDQGTVFTILFPACSSIEAGNDETYEISSLGGDEHILFVDDEEMLVSSMVKMLTHHGYKVTGKTDSEQALKLFRDAPETFDLVITDYTMPKMTGKELIKAILAIRPDIPVIICTGFTEMLNAQTAKNLGARDFLMKPLTVQLMASSIRKILDNEK